MALRFRIVWLACLLLLGSARGQGILYSPDSIPEIRITFAQSNWKAALDSVFKAFGEDGRLQADVSINGSLFHKAGIRYKGYSSWNENEIKNPLNIELDYCIPHQNYDGYSKLKLSNVIHDPSFVREVLSYDIARKYMPASKANFAKVFANDVFIGLYTNVEAVDDQFLLDRFGGKDGSFFKGKPEHLVYPVGENSNLAYTHGTDSTAYFPYYQIQSVYGWNELLNLIRILGSSPDSIALVLNVDRALWMHALNYALLNLDSYIAYAQNYYVYSDTDGRFNTIPWDFNMSFGSFRNSDGSTNIQTLSINKLINLDPLQHLYFSAAPRPLLSKLLANATWRKMYLAHLRTLINENIQNQWYYQEAKWWQNRIANVVFSDTNKFYGDSDFIKNLDTTVFPTGAGMYYPGLKNLMTGRAAYLASYLGIMGQPNLEQPNLAGKINTGGNVALSVIASKASKVFLAYRNTSSGPFLFQEMKDDGLHGDGTANDGVFGSRLNLDGHILQYYFYAENDSAAAFLPERAENEYFTTWFAPQAHELVLNEINPAIDGSQGWIEIKNNGPEPLMLDGCTINLGQAGQIMLPDTLIGSNGLLVFPSPAAPWAHSSAYDAFSVQLLGAEGQLLDSTCLYTHAPYATWGRYPNGYGPFTFMQASPSRPNLIGLNSTDALQLSPNPASGYILAIVDDAPGYNSLTVTDVAGRTVYSSHWNGSGSVNSIKISLQGYKNSLYLAFYTHDGHTLTKSFIVK